MSRYEGLSEQEIEDERYYEAHQFDDMLADMEREEEERKREIREGRMDAVKTIVAWALIIVVYAFFAARKQIRSRNPQTAR